MGGGRRVVEGSSDRNRHCRALEVLEVAILDEVVSFLYATVEVESLIWLHDGFWMRPAPSEVAVRAAVASALSKNGVAGTADGVLCVEPLRAARDALIDALPAPGLAFSRSSTSAHSGHRPPLQQHSATLAHGMTHTAEQTRRLFGLPGKIRSHLCGRGDNMPTGTPAVLILPPKKWEKKDSLGGECLDLWMMSFAVRDFC